MLVVEGRSEQESKRNLVLCGRNVADPFEGGIAERIVDWEIVNTPCPVELGDSVEFVRCDRESSKPVTRDPKQYQPFHFGRHDFLATVGGLHPVLIKIMYPP